jgi:hypothetical protein
MIPLVPSVKAAWEDDGARRVEGMRGAGLRVN